VQTIVLIKTKIQLSDPTRDDEFNEKPRVTNFKGRCMT
jgi:hypothetical protein